jgi:hypothetical protein
MPQWTPDEIAQIRKERNARNAVIWRRMSVLVSRRRIAFGEILPDTGPHDKQSYHCRRTLANMSKKK